MADEYRLSYTGQQVDEAIGKALTGLPTITIALSQVISQNPMQVQLTNEQYQIFANNKQIVLDMTAFGMGYTIANFKSSYDEEGTDYIDFIFTYCNAGGYLLSNRIFVNVSSKVAEVQEVYPIKADSTEGSYHATVAYSFACTYSAPTTYNEGGDIKIVVLDSEPAQFYGGWLYLIRSN